MTDIRIILKRPSGEISVVLPVTKGRRKGEGEKDWIERVAAKVMIDRPEGTIRLPDCLCTELPSREFRNKWRADSDGKVFVDTSIPDPIIEPTEMELLKERVIALEKQ